MRSRVSLLQCRSFAIHRSAGYSFKSGSGPCGTLIQMKMKPQEVEGLRLCQARAAPSAARGGRIRSGESYPDGATTQTPPPGACVVIDVEEPTARRPRARKPTTVSSHSGGDNIACASRCRQRLDQRSKAVSAGNVGQTAVKSPNPWARSPFACLELPSSQPARTSSISGSGG